jgi:hypothetical protein
MNEIIIARQHMRKTVSDSEGATIVPIGRAGVPDRAFSCDLRFPTEVRLWA